MSVEDFVRLERLHKHYPMPSGQPLVVLEDVNWRVPRGAAVAVIGPSGAGKSTLLNLIGGLDWPTSGTIFVGGKNLQALDEKALAAYRASEVGFVFQEHHLLPQLTALENVLIPTLALACQRDKQTGTRRQAAALEKKAEQTRLATWRAESSAPMKRATALLERVGLGARLNAFPAQLSGGERQRVAIARALMNKPALLLADEPTGNLDQATGAQIIALLLSLAREEELTVILVTHNLQHAATCQRIYELKAGQLTEVAQSQ